MHHAKTLLSAALLLVFLAGCETIAPKDYTLFRQYHPRSILVLPPLNESVSENATYGYLSTVTSPLAELGYYVYPVAVIDQFLKENGMPTPGEMHQVSLEKIDEIIGADAVLYITIRDYGTKFRAISSVTVVSASARLVDVKTGTEIWTDDVYLEESPSNNSSGGLAGVLVAAVVNQIISSKTDAAHNTARNANVMLLSAKDQGLLPGPYIPEDSTASSR